VIARLNREIVKAAKHRRAGPLMAELKLLVQ
jgi:hypothetical protein